MKILTDDFEAIVEETRKIVEETRILKGFVNEYTFYAFVNIFHILKCRKCCF